MDNDVERLLRLLRGDPERGQPKRSIRQVAEALRLDKRAVAKWLRGGQIRPDNRTALRRLLARHEAKARGVPLRRQQLERALKAFLLDAHVKDGWKREAAAHYMQSISHVLDNAAKLSLAETKDRYSDARRGMAKKGSSTEGAASSHAAFDAHFNVYRFTGTPVAVGQVEPLPPFIEGLGGPPGEWGTGTAEPLQPSKAKRSPKAP